MSWPVSSPSCRAWTTGMVDTHMFTHTHTHTHVHTHTHTHTHTLSSLFAAAMLCQLEAQHPGSSLARLQDTKYQHHPGGQLKAGRSVELVLVMHSKFSIRQRKQMSSNAQLPLSVFPETEPRSSVIPSWLKEGSCNSLQDVRRAFHFRVWHLEVNGYFCTGLDFSDATSNSESTFPFCHPWLVGFLSSDCLKITAPAPGITSAFQKDRREKGCHSSSLY